MYFNDKSTPAPLAERMRPEAIEELLGQEHLLGPGRILRQAIEKDHIPSFILWGSPGSGKTSLASIIKKSASAHFVTLAAVTSGVKDVRGLVEEARLRLERENKKTILFVDEIHRFNKAQQDAFLPHVEKGLITLIGATTENPYFEVITPLLSRTRIFKLNPLSDEHMKTIIMKAVSDEERGLGRVNVKISEEALEILAACAGGDARVALNTLETASMMAPRKNDQFVHVEKNHVLEVLQQKNSPYDKNGEAHYDVISAFIKSVRGSSPDGAIYYLARMLHNGEDPKFIARRLIILASEDIGLADPFALNIANAAAYAVQFVGMPEARIILAEATLYLSGAPKSNSAYLAIDKALAEAENNPFVPVPLHLRNPVTKGMKDSGYGLGYKYAHDYPGHFVEMEFLPEKIKNARFYQPGISGHEIKMKDRLEKWWRRPVSDGK